MNEEFDKDGFALIVNGVGTYQQHSSIDRGIDAMLLALGFDGAQSLAGFGQK